MRDQSTKGIVMHGSARFYDLGTRLLGLTSRFYPMAADLCGASRGERVLDAGCGTGSLCMILAGRVGPEGVVVGVDASPEMLAAARRKGRRRGSPARFLRGLMEELPFGDGSFHLAVSTLAFHHLPLDLKRTALKEMKRVVRPGGRVFIGDFGKPSGAAKLLALPLYAVEYTADNLRGMLPSLMEDAGLAGVEEAGELLGMIRFYRAVKGR